MFYIQIVGEGWYPCDSAGSIMGDEIPGTPQATLSKVTEGALYTVWKVEAWGIGAKPALEDRLQARGETGKADRN